MSPRRDVPEAHRALKTLFRAVLQRCGGLDAAASCVRVGRSQLANYTDMHSDQFAPLDVVAELEAVAGEPLVTAELARRAGCLLVPMVTGGEESLAQYMAQLGRELGEVFAGYAGAMADDGRVDAAEAEGMERELGDLIRVATRALGTLRQGRA
jgi:hypothetical protein